MTGPTIVSIVNHKGGCLKTTVTANLGAALARAGKRVLVLDLDAQQNLTQSLIGSVELVDGTPTLYDAFLDEASLDALITRTPQENLDLVPCAEDFVGADRASPEGDKGVHINNSSQLKLGEVTLVFFDAAALHTWVRGQFTKK